MAAGTSSTATPSEFETLFEQSLVDVDLRPGALIKATILEINPKYVIVNAGLKSEPVIPRNEFTDDENIAIGQEIDVVIENPGNAFGETCVSHEKAKRAHAWAELSKSFEAAEPVTGMIVERVKGGFTVALDVIRAFLPGSLVDVKPVRDPGYLEGKELEFKIIKMDPRRNNIVVSRRAVMEAETDAERQARLDELQEGQEVVGIVKNITDYGAFIDLGGIDGLLHITDMAWKRVRHPSELLNVGDEMRVKVLRFDRDKNRVSLGLKQLGEDPWQNIARRYPAGARLSGQITNITDYGCFVEIEEGVEGLVHMSEMDWTNKNIHPSKVVKIGQQVDVVVLDIDENRRRISLGIKQTRPNPWEEFASQHDKGEYIVGKIKSITDFGLFIGLDGNIDGLVHLSDISWTLPGEQAIREFKRGDEVKAIILSIDAERERISLGIKQLEQDPMTDFVERHEKGDVILAKVVEVNAKQATLELTENVTGILKASDYKTARGKDLTESLQVDEEINVVITSVDKKNRQLFVSTDLSQAKSATPGQRPGAATRQAMAKQPTKATLGDLLKQQMQQKEKDDEEEQEQKQDTSKAESPKSDDDEG